MVMRLTGMQFCVDELYSPLSSNLCCIASRYVCRHVTRRQGGGDLYSPANKNSYSSR